MIITIIIIIIIIIIKIAGDVYGFMERDTILSD